VESKTVALKKYWINGKESSIETNAFLFELISWNSQSKIITAKIGTRIRKAKILSSPNEKSRKYVLYFFHNKQKLSIEQTPPKKNISSSQSLFNPTLCSPIGGKVIAIHAEPNEMIKKNQPLITIESMKMENIIHATSDAFIKTISICEGDLVQTKQRLMLFEPRSSKNATTQSSYVKKEISNR
jgi:biotin carboxyl carrier protein